jgi:hypothetical protein
LETITVDELIGLLKASEEQINHNSRKIVVGLNLTVDELVARMSSCLKVSGIGSSDCPNELSSCTDKCRRGKGVAQVAAMEITVATTLAERTPVAVVADECFYCGKHGHWAHECRKK